MRNNKRNCIISCPIENNRERETCDLVFTDIRKSPDVAEVDGETDDGQKEFRFFGPCFTLFKGRQRTCFRPEASGTCGRFRKETNDLRFVFVFPMI